MDSTLFRHQAEISPDKWGSFGAGAGISDTVQLLACVKKERFAERVRSDMELGERLGVQGTPAVFVNRDELEAGAPTLVTLDSIARRAISRAK
jgi:protein-disulfide isomerase